MALVAKRISTESWSEALARIASDKQIERECLAAFETRKAAGYKDYEAAYLALEEFGCLDYVNLPGDPQQPLNQAESDQIEPPGS
jgi:hypothetical protein